MQAEQARGGLAVELAECHHDMSERLCAVGKFSAHGTCIHACMYGHREVRMHVSVCDCMIFYA